MKGELIALNCGYDGHICLGCPLNHGIDGETWRDYKTLAAARNLLQRSEVSAEELEEEGFRNSDIQEMYDCIELSRETD